MNKKLLIGLFCLLFFLLLAIVAYNRTIDYEACIVEVSTIDNAILVRWDSLPPKVRNLQIIISDQDKSLVAKETVQNPLPSDYILFTDGIHGEKYTIRVMSSGFFMKSHELFLGKRMLVNFAELDSFPLLEIRTDDQDYLDFSIAEKPDDSLWGISIEDNTYSKGTMTFTRFEETFTQRIKIKVRGNTSATWAKKPYKILLSSAEDLLGLGSEHADTEWVLLNTGAELNTYYGLCISELVGLEWTPKMMFVNLLLDGDWKGCYILIESIEEGESRVNVGKFGFIVEDNAYWWKEPVSFRTTNMIPEMAYTIKYPSINVSSDNRVRLLQEYFQSIEDSFSGQSGISYEDKIDTISFARWILAKDILGTLDGGGANIFYYASDFFLDRTNCKLKMGPLWDFDTDYKLRNSWSNSRYSNGTFFEQLFQDESFYLLYVDQWQQIRKDLLPFINERSAELIETYGESMEKSWIVDNNRWNGHGETSLAHSTSLYRLWFFDRMHWINEQLSLK